MITKAQHEATFANAERELETFIDSEIKRQAASQHVYITFPYQVDWKIEKSLRTKYENAGWNIDATGGRDFRGEPIPDWHMT